MKTWMFSMAMGGLTVAAAFTPLRAQQGASGAGRSVWDGVYTESQAKRGGQVYASQCVNCHGNTLQGDGPASALTGPGFTADFDGANLGEMLDRTRTTMPEDKPGTMSRQQVADVLAYVLSFNKFPAGETELPTQAEALNQIKFLATKPTGKIEDGTRRRP
jgi:mono/diheme cytochrome c family protein